eukprot:IDg14008t1
MQEAKKQKLHSGENLATHFANLERLFNVYKFDARRVWNCDEIGATPERDVMGRTMKRWYLDRDRTRDMKVAEFRTVHEVPMQPMVSAAADVGPSLFIFKGTHLPYRIVVRKGFDEVETYPPFLPTNSLITCCAEFGGVD